MIDSSKEIVTRNGESHVFFVCHMWLICICPLYIPADIEDNLNTVPSSGLDTEALGRLSNVGKSATEVMISILYYDILENKYPLDSNLIPIRMIISMSRMLIYFRSWNALLILFLKLQLKQVTNENIIGPFYARHRFLMCYLSCLRSQTGNEESPSQSKIDTDSEHAKKFLTSYSIDPEVPNSMLPAEDLTVQAHCSIDSSEFTMCEVVPPQTGLEYEKVPVENERSEIMVSI